MDIEYSSHFKKEYGKLNHYLQKKAEKREIVFRNNVFDPRLKTHKLHAKLKKFYSFSVGDKYRIVFALVSRSRALFLDIGDHDIYR